ncbi:RNA exonuclease 5 [Leptodactylus fuscus]|uniref:RNA exonuclease 5 n=1 Tax=Leptodactylus fuscus TaxID=238119 RepID=UPI003F4F3058
MKQRKRPRSNEDDNTGSKKRREEVTRIQESVNGLKSQQSRKAPRLSPALFCDNCEIHLLQLHQLLKYVVIGKKGNAAQASWCSVHHQKRLGGVVLVVLQGLAQHHFYQFYTHFHFLRRLFTHRFSLLPPPSDFMASLLGISGLDGPNQNERTDDLLSTQGSADQKSHLFAAPEPTKSLDPILQKYGRSKRGLTRYLLTEEEMRTNHYPLLGSLGTENYVHTKCTEKPTDSSPLYGLDCEMCMTCKGSELTRVALVNAEGQCILDELVKPDNPIINYMTRFSGITRKMLQGVKTKLKDVQEKIKSLLPPDAVLVGHSLNNDLRAVQMIHPNVIDTSLIYTRKSGWKFRLKFLAQAVLKREIQCKDVLGHDPSEDAAAALNLAQFIIQEGPEQVADMNLEDIFLTTNYFSRPASPKASEIKQNGFLHPLPSAASFLEDLEKAGQKISYVSRDGLKDPAHVRQVESVLCTSDEEVLERVCSVSPWAPVTIVEFQSGNVFNKFHVDTKDKIACKFAEMMTVFAGPFKNNVCLKTVKMHFESCGPIHSLSVVSDTCQPYISLTFGVPEAAQLAVEHLNGSCIDGCRIKVRRMMTRSSVDHEEVFKEMEGDAENSDTIYVSGFTRPLTEESLQKQFNHFKEIKSIFVPSNPRSRHPAKYCYIKFHSPEAAGAANEDIRTHGGLRSMKAVTSSHLHRWLQTAVTSVSSHQPGNQEVVPEADLIAIIKDLDQKVHRLYESLVADTLCVLLLPGNNSAGSFPGFGAMGIKL